MKKLLPLLLALLLLTGCAETYDGPTTTKLVLNETITEGYWDWGDSAYISRTVYAYDIYGNQAQWIDYNEDEPVRKTVLRYDDRGNLLRDTYYDLQGWLPKKTSETSYTYDDQNRLTSVTNDYGGGDVSSYTITYDDVANTRTTRYSADLYTVEYLNEAGHVIRSEATHKDGTLDVEEYTLRPDGQPLTYTFAINGIENFTILYEYDGQGRKTRQTLLENGVETQQFRWEYDDKNNCVTRYDADGGYELTGYNDDGTEKVRQSWDNNGNIQAMTLYRYREIRIPLEGSDTP